MAGEVGACQPPLNRYNPEPVEGWIDWPMHSRRTRKRRRQKIWHSRKRKKANRSQEDGWLFLFVPIVAETLSVLKEAGW